MGLLSMKRKSKWRDEFNNALLQYKAQHQHNRYRKHTQKPIQLETKLCKGG
jgi:hypothetical protein